MVAGDLVAAALGDGGPWGCLRRTAPGLGPWPVAGPVPEALGWLVIGAVRAPPTPPREGLSVPLPRSGAREVGESRLGGPWSDTSFFEYVLSRTTPVRMLADTAGEQGAEVHAGGQDSWADAGEPSVRRAWAYWRAWLPTTTRCSRACTRSSPTWASDSELGAARSEVGRPGRRAAADRGPRAGASTWTHLPEAVTSVVAIEPSDSMRAASLPRVEAARARGLEVELIDAVGEALPLPDNSVDCVLFAYVLCSVDSVPDVLAEARRAAAPGWDGVRA